MTQLFSTLWQIVTWMIALAVFVGLMWHFAKAHSHLWRQVAAGYSARRPRDAISRKFPEVAILTSGGLSYRAYAALAIAVHDDGLSLSLAPPFNVMCPRLFLPFDEMELKPTWWGMLREPQAIRMARTPGVDIVIDQRVVRWIREHHGRSPFA